MLKKNIFTILILILLISSCSHEVLDSTPKKKIFFPRASIQCLNSLIIVSGNDDLRYKSGNILSINLKIIDKYLQNFKNKKNNINYRIINDKLIIQSSKNLSSLSNKPVFFPKTNHLIISTRGINKITHFQFKNNIFRKKNIIKSLLRNPYYIETFRYQNKKIAIIASNNSANLNIINLYSDKIQINKKTISLNNINIENNYNTKFFKKKSLIIRDLKVSYKDKGTSKSLILFILLDLLQNNNKKLIKLKKSFIIWFKINKEVLNGNLMQKNIKIIDFTKLGLGTQAKNLNLLKNNQSIMYVLLRNPNSIITINYKENYNKKEILINTTSTCKEARNIIIDKNNFFISCFDDSSIISYNNLSLKIKNMIKSFGCGPIFLNFDKRQYRSNRLYATFLNSDNIGIFTKKLLPIAQISLK